MASSTALKDKEGRVYGYQLKVYRGRDISGKQLKPFSTIWHIPDGMTNPRTIKKELEKQKASFENECKAGSVALNRPTYEHYSNYVLELKERDCKRSTVSRYKKLNQRIIEELGHFKLDEITAEHLNHFYKKLGEEGANEATGGGLAAKTIREYHSLISVVLSQAVREQLIRSNIAKTATPPKLRKKEAEFFEPEDVERIMECLAKEPLKWRVITLLIIATGARRGEIMGLRWKHVDFKKNTIKIYDNLLYAHGFGTYDDTTKSDKSRIVMVDGSVMQLLQQHKQDQLELRFALQEDWEGESKFDESHCFTQKTGKPMNPNSITDWLWKFSKRYNLPHVYPHKFRHTLASVLISEKIDPVTVSKWLGHQQVSTTEEIYAHMFRKANEEAASVVSDVLFGGKKY